MLFTIIYINLILKKYEYFNKKKGENDQPSIGKVGKSVSTIPLVA
jgi:hypothetical protein